MNSTLWVFPLMGRSLLRRRRVRKGVSARLRKGPRNIDTHSGPLRTVNSWAKSVSQWFPLLELSSSVKALSIIIQIYSNCEVISSTALWRKTKSVGSGALKFISMLFDNIKHEISIFILHLLNYVQLDICKNMFTVGAKLLPPPWFDMSNKFSWNHGGASLFWSKTAIFRPSPRFYMSKKVSWNHGGEVIWHPR